MADDNDPSEAPADLAPANEPATAEARADDRPPDRHERVIRAALLFQLQQHQADALDEVLTLYDEVTDANATGGADGERLVAIARLLGDPDVADAFYNDAAGLDAERAKQAEAFGDAIRDATAHLSSTRANATARAVGSWVVAQARHTQARTDQVEALLDESLAADPSYRPALELAAHYASDRGDAPRAMSLARRAGVPENDSWLQLLSSMIPRQRANLGRNDPCFCGSGRKYKQCHLRNTETPLEQRADWLWNKAIDHLQDSRWQHRLVAVGDARLGVDATTYDSMTFAMTDAVVADLVLFFDGAWADFLQVRGPLLPADERALATTWSTIERRLYEVTAIEPGQTVTVRPVDDGAAAIVVTESTYSRGAELGDVVWARVAPVGATQQFFGGLVPVLTEPHRAELTALLASGPDAVAVAQLLRSWEGAPVITNTEGEPLVFLTTTFRVTDADALAAALDARGELERVEPGGAHATADASAVEGIPSAFGSDDDPSPLVGQWAEHITVNDSTWIRGTLSLHDDRIVLRTNSDQRDARLRALLDELVPGAELLDEHRAPFTSTD